MRPVAMLIAALALAGTPALAAQGGGKAFRGAAATPLAPVGRPLLAPARSILQRLVGTWRFELWFAGNIAGPPDVAGTRVVRPLFDDLRVEWTEAIDSSPIRGQGVIGFDSRSERFFSTAVFNAGSGAELMTGAMDLADGLITFTPMELGPSPERDPDEPRAPLAGSSALSMLDANHFMWVALDRGWRALFTRQPPPPPPASALTPSVDPAPPTPVDAAPPTPVDAVPPTPVDSASPTPVDSAPPTPVDSAPPTPVDSALPTPVDSAPPTPVDSAPPASVGSAPPTPVDFAPPTPVDAAPPTPVDSAKAMGDRLRSVGADPRPGERPVRPRARRDRAARHDDEPRCVNDVLRGAISRMPIAAPRAHRHSVRPT